MGARGKPKQVQGRSAGRRVFAFEALARETRVKDQTQREPNEIQVKQNRGLKSGAKAAARRKVLSSSSVRGNAASRDPRTRGNVGASLSQGLKVP